MGGDANLVPGDGPRLPRDGGAKTKRHDAFTRLRHPGLERQSNKAFRRPGREKERDIDAARLDQPNDLRRHAIGLARLVDHGATHGETGFRQQPGKIAGDMGAGDMQQRAASGFQPFHHQLGQRVDVAAGA